MSKARHEIVVITGASAGIGRAAVQQFARRGGEGRIPALSAIFKTASRLEADFWQMGLAAIRNSC